MARIAMMLHHTAQNKNPHSSYCTAAAAVLYDNVYVNRMPLNGTVTGQSQTARELQTRYLLGTLRLRLLTTNESVPSVSAVYKQQQRQLNINDNKPISNYTAMIFVTWQTKIASSQCNLSHNSRAKKTRNLS